MSPGSDTISQALDDFHLARRRAVLEEFFSRFTGADIRLLSFDEVRQQLKIQGTLDRGIHNIPLNAIIGSVNRYEDFTRSFLPRRNVDPKRWAKIVVAANGTAGLPPIDVYKIGEVYFVIDGNHRVSVAKQIGAASIQAYVREVPSPVTIEAGDQLDEVLLKAEYSRFIEETQLDSLRPESHVRFTSPGQYPRLLENIKGYHQLLEIDQRKNVSFHEAVGDWYDHVYLPVIELIREQGLQHEFPHRTEADLFLWIKEHRIELEESLQQPIETLAAITHLAEKYSPTVERKATRITGSIKNTLIPASLDQGPAPGAWRVEKTGRLTIGRQPLPILFSEILVPLDGSEAGWSALDQAVIIAVKEGSRINGLHILPTRQKNLQEPSSLQEIFRRRMDQAGLAGDLTVVHGPLTQTILERSRWNDLVVVDVNLPPSKNQKPSLNRKPSPSIRAKFSSGLREIILRCPRPVLAVHQTISQLTHPLLAYDDSPKSREALFVATYLSGKWQLPITIIGVDEPDKEILPALESASDYLRFRTGRQGIVPKLIHHSGPIDTSILLSAEEEDCDWIIMGGYGHSPVANLLVDHVLDRILRSTNRPVLLCR